MDYKDDCENLPDSRRVGNTSKSRLERIESFPFLKSDYKFIQILKEFYLSFDLSEECYNGLLELIDECPANFLVALLKIIIDLSEEDDVILNSMLDEEISRRLTMKLVSKYPQTIEANVYLLTFYCKALDEHKVQTIPQPVIDYPFMLTSSLSSDTVPGFEFSVQPIVQLNKLSNKMLASMILSGFIDAKERLEECLHKFLYSAQSPFEEVVLSGLVSISNVSATYPDEFGTIFQSSEFLHQLIKFVGRNQSDCIQIAALDIFINLTAAKDERAVCFLLDLGFLDLLSIRGRSQEFTETFCEFMQNVFCCGEFVIEIALKSEAIENLIFLLQNGSLNIKVKASLAFSALMTTDLALDFFSTHEILDLIFETIESFDKGQLDSFSICALSLFSKADTAKNVQILQSFYNDDFIENIQEILDENYENEYLSRLEHFLIESDEK